MKSVSERKQEIQFGVHISNKSPMRLLVPMVHEIVFKQRKQGMAKSLSLLSSSVNFLYFICLRPAS